MLIYGTFFSLLGFLPLNNPPSDVIHALFLSFFMIDIFKVIVLNILSAIKMESF
jgi:hypothetical protein